LLGMRSFYVFYYKGKPCPDGLDEKPLTKFRNNMLSPQYGRAKPADHNHPSE